MSSEKKFNDGAAVKVSMSKLVDGINIIFAGVGQVLTALEPQVARELVDNVIEEAGLQSQAESGVKDDEDEKAGAFAGTVAGVVDDGGNAVSADEGNAVEAAVSAPAASRAAESPVDAQPSISLDDITKIIVRKLKQDRSNREKVSAILASYGYERVSDLPAEKYEQFVTDLSQL